MAKNKSNSNNPVLTGYDIVNGKTTNNQINGILNEMTPWHMVEDVDKTEGWVKWNADYLETLGIRQVTNKSPKIIKNRRMSAGILDLSDYQYNIGEFAHLTNIVVPENDHDPLKQFYPLVPPVKNVLLGEFLKRDKSMDVYCSDKYTIQDKLDVKFQDVKGMVTQQNMELKKAALQKMGIEEADQTGQPNQQFTQEMEAAQKLIDIEFKFKSYKHIMEEYGQHVANVDRKRFNIDRLEETAFSEVLDNSVEFWHIDLLEEDYNLELLDSKDCFYHMSPSIHYVHEGDYFGWFKDMTVGDIINNLGKELTESQINTLKEVLSSYMGNNSYGGILLTDDQAAAPAAYYDASKPYPLGKTNLGMNHANVHDALNRMAANFSNKSSDDLINESKNRNDLEGQPKLFKVMFSYFKSQRKIGWLTKVSKDGTTEVGKWIDETFKVTEKPEYDNSLTKENTKTNLIYGEHIDWTWTNEWRVVKKINSNNLSLFWKNYDIGWDPIYIGGERVKFQFKGDNDPFTCYPPIVGAEFRTRGVRPVSLVDLLYPSQIIYNICKNKVPAIISQDPGKVLSIFSGISRPNHLGAKAENPLDKLMHNIYENKIIDVNVDIELLTKIGNSGMTAPTVVDMSRIQEAIAYDSLAKSVKEDAYELIGITRQRLGQQKAYETGGSVQSAVNFSESQTEVYFNQHSNNLMPLVYQRLLEANQYYSTTKPESDAYYRNGDGQNVFLRVENMDKLLRDYNVLPNSSAKTKEMKARLIELFMNDNTLPVTSLDRAEVLTTETVSGIMNKIRVAQVKRDEMEEQKAKAEQDAQKAQFDHEAEILKATQDFDAEQNRLDRESAENIANTRAMGGIQTDANSNNELDSQENLMQWKFKEKELQNKNSLEQDKLKMNQSIKEKDLETKNDLANKKLAMEQKKLAAAIVNENRYTDHKMSQDIAKAQKVNK